MDRVKKAAKLKNISIINDVKTQKVAGNPQSLTDLISILLDNAIKFTALRYSEKPGGEIHVELQKNEALGVAVDSVGVKATTTERLGFEGRV